MNRRGFLRNIGLASAALTLSPLISFAEPAKRIVYVTGSPVFTLFYAKDGKEYKCIANVSTYRASLKELVKRTPADRLLFFYEELESPLIYDSPMSLMPHRYNLVRAAILNLGTDITLLGKHKKIEVYE